MPLKNTAPGGRPGDGDGGNVTGAPTGKVTTLPAERQDRLSVRLYPDLLPQVTRRGQALPFALWYLGRALARGSGRIDAEDLKDGALRLWSLDKYYRGLREAVRLGLVAKVKRRCDGAIVVELRSLEKVAERFGLASVDATPIVVRASALATTAKFKAAHFCAYQAGRAGDARRPISRETLRSLTGISRRTQAHYEKVNNIRRNGQVHRTANFALTGYEPDDLRGARDHLHGACFLYGGRVVRPLPNSYRSTLHLASRSRVRKVSRILKGKGGLVMTGAGQHNQRVFFVDRKDAERAARAEKASPVVYYRARRAYRGAGVWRMPDGSQNYLTQVAKAQLQYLPI